MSSTQQIVNYIQHPEMLAHMELEQIDQLIEQYPFFQSLYLLKAKKVASTSPEGLSNILPKVSIVSVDRKKLKNYIEAPIFSVTPSADVQETIVESTPSADVQEPIVESTPSADVLEPIVESTPPADVLEPIVESTPPADVKEFIETLPPVEPLPEKASMSSATLSFMSWLKQKSNPLPNDFKDPILPRIRLDLSKPIEQVDAADEEKDALDFLYTESIFHLGEYEQLDVKKNESDHAPKAEGEKVSKQMDIIDKFIQNETNIKIRRDFSDVPQENMAKKSSVESDAFITETMAEIFIQQKLYKKAINAYKKLSLKNPEKSVYFAGQIDKILKLYPELNQEN